MARVPASGTTRKRISELLSGEFDKSELVKAAMQLIVEEALDGLPPILRTLPIGAV
ncbi:MAG: hypothetical protein ACREX9_24175 [Gammaproteobacteria bacterium]